MRREFGWGRSLRRLARTFPSGRRKHGTERAPMAKTSKSKTLRNERQKVIEQMRAQQKAAERRRGLTIVAVCAVASVIVCPVVILAWLEYWSIKRRAARYESERRASCSSDELP